MCEHRRGLKGASVMVVTVPNWLSVWMMCASALWKDVTRLWTVKAVSSSCNQKTTIIRSVWGDKKVQESLTLQAEDEIICYLTGRVNIFTPCHSIECNMMLTAHVQTSHHTDDVPHHVSFKLLNIWILKKDCREGCVVAMSCHRSEEIYWNLSFSSPEKIFLQRPHTQSHNLIFGWKYFSIIWPSHRSMMRCQCSDIHWGIDQYYKQSGLAELREIC